ncbi:MAG TPA: rhomboid family intramembrane serine protease [Verrucomicrobiae bacterium]|jgi:membrane associated rhomboid family serine protease
MEQPPLRIPAHSRRQAMEWGLVLASQGLEPVVDHSEEEGWALLVEEQDQDLALASLKQYQLENRGWRWKQAGMLFHWGGLGWAAAIAAFYYWSAVRFPAFRDAGILDSAKIREGQWWRIWTAITLHENISHLAANASTGFILMGLAMARYGAGVALLAAFVAGAAGNVASFLFYSQPHESLGASGMVTGALGLVIVQSFSQWRRHAFGRGLFFRALSAGVLLIVALVGFSPSSDTAAHLGGFAAGAILGCALGFVPPRRLHGGLASAAALLALAALLGSTWRLALHAP